MIFIGIIGIATLIVLIVLVIDLILLHQNRVLKHENEKIIIKTQFQEEIQKVRLEVSEETFKKVGQEIHDNWGQILSFTSLMLSQKKETIGDNFKLMEEARRNIGNVIDSIRELSHSFENSSKVAGTLFEQLKHLKLMNEKTGIVKNKLTLEGNPTFVDSETSIIIIRITQELMNNSVRHGNASLCNLHVLIDKVDLQYKYSDNGIGFKYSLDFETGGTGILNIKSRLKLLKAKYNIYSNPGIGFHLKATIPIEINHSL